MAVVTAQEPKEILYLKSPNGISGANETFNALEAKLPTLKKRKFYGLIVGPDKEYWASVEQIQEDNPKKMGLEVGTIPGGKYVQETLQDWSKNIPKFKEIFRRLMSDFSFDKSRPCIEYYRSLTEAVLRVPVKD